MMKSRKMLMFLICILVVLASINSVNNVSVLNAQDVVEEIDSKAELLDLLNKNKVDSGKVYKLMDDFTIDASELSNEYFDIPSTSSKSYYEFNSSIDGNGQSITVNVSENELGRSLFHRMYGTVSNPISIKNLEVIYNGDASITPFIRGTLSWSYSLLHGYKHISKCNWHNRQSSNKNTS